MSKVNYDQIVTNTYVTSSYKSDQWNSVYTAVNAGSASWATSVIQPFGPDKSIQYNVGDCCLGGDGYMTVLCNCNLSLGVNNKFTYNNCIVSQPEQSTQNLFIGECNSINFSLNGNVVGGKNSALNYGGYISIPSCYFSASSAEDDYPGTNVYVSSGDGSLGSQSSTQKQHFYYFGNLNGDPLQPEAPFLNHAYFGNFIEFWDRENITIDTKVTANFLTKFETSTGTFTHLYTNSGNETLTGSVQGPGTDFWGDVVFDFINGTRILSTPNYSTYSFEQLCVYTSKRRYINTPSGSYYIVNYDDHLIGSNICINNPLITELSASYVFDPSAAVAYNMYLGADTYPNQKFFLHTTYFDMQSGGAPQFIFDDVNKNTVILGNRVSGNGQGININSYNKLLYGSTTRSLAIGGSQNVAADRNISIGGRNNTNSGYYALNLGGENLNDTNISPNYYYANLGGNKNFGGVLNGCENFSYNYYNIVSVLQGYKNCWVSIAGCCNGPPSPEYAGAWNSWFGNWAGSNNKQYQYATTVLGGLSNNGSNSYGTTWAGTQNRTTYGGTTFGGECNCMDNGISVIGAGKNNWVANNYPAQYYESAVFIGAGYNNRKLQSGDYSSIIAGYDNSTNCTHTHMVGSNLTATNSFYTYTQNVSSQGIVTGNGLYFNNLSANMADCTNRVCTGVFLTLTIGESSLLLPLYC